jgi:hypothetical protein
LGRAWRGSGRSPRGSAASAAVRQPRERREMSRGQRCARSVRRFLRTPGSALSRSPAGRHFQTRRFS